MVERLFEYLFVAALFAPPTAVVAGVLLLLIGPRGRHHVRHAPHAVGA